MAGVADGAHARSVVLDAGALIQLQRGDDHTRALLDQATRRNYPVVIPPPVIAQVHRGDHDHAGLDRIFKMAKRLVPTSEEIARRAGELLGRAGLSDAVDAIVAAEALDNAPSMIVTSDPDDLTRLTDGDPEGARYAALALVVQAARRAKPAPETLRAQLQGARPGRHHTAVVLVDPGLGDLEGCPELAVSPRVGGHFNGLFRSGAQGSQEKGTTER